MNQLLHVKMAAIEQEVLAKTAELIDYVPGLRHAVETPWTNNHTADIGLKSLAGGATGMAAGYGLNWLIKKLMGNRRRRQWI